MMITYCNEQADQGLTCAKENLVLVRRLSEDLSPTREHIESLYQCKVCQGLYKYIYASSYQTRNLDSEEGWYVYEDYYYKVGERNAAGNLQFPLKEARIYGYQGEDPSLTLHSPDQLPDIPGDELIFSWDQLESESIIRHGDRVIWQETTGWEVYDRFVEIVEILKQKYGRRLADVVPTLRSEYALYGDAAKAGTMFRTPVNRSPGVSELPVHHSRTLRG